MNEASSHKKKLGVRHRRHIRALIFNKVGNSLDQKKESKGRIILKLLCLINVA